MTEQEQDWIELYFKGEMSVEDRKKFESRLNTEVEFAKRVQDYQAVQDLLEHEVEEGLRESFKRISEEEGIGNEQFIFNRYWILATIIGALLIIGIAITVKLNEISKDDIARQYAIQEVADRDRTPFRILDTVLFEHYVDHLKAANLFIQNKDFPSARNAINKISYDHDIARDNKEWMIGLIAYLEKGRSNDEFHRIINKILDDPEHACYQMAVDLDSKVNSFWGRLKE